MTEILPVHFVLVAVLVLRNATPNIAEGTWNE
jgi:hypothetical protein